MSLEHRTRPVGLLGLSAGIHLGLFPSLFGVIPVLKYRTPTRICWKTMINNIIIILTATFSINPPFPSFRANERYSCVLSVFMAPM